ncbi:MAG: hypothetical protein COV74_05070 [Candidatus Omnitrophica bacterium CG11_big_fil_rev_8_21_14_0_20_45_26]|uniref:DUF503 domain-containing protein n=1 Tax=Candidatus Abzuiibacterium crystallinum TaxID=1974748 RepID=A0A2H0LPS4_9BACT|nr:MAG: hypothetical protein COV74_05070 [Candidatus Omnitrophica bacterium CG11_big_fil_rev_8_21_14_0_20_45_26]PIW64366.1 MAG: DUF503 domain-containing protein [Candidatus Omnitrophica bacterium CG12_big_fil_rev_8_21_14_0_65_45_16]
MTIGLLQLKVHFPNPQSLKEKRSILKRLHAKFRREFNAALSEIGDMNLWQSSVLASVCVARERQEAEKQLHRIMNFFDQERQLEVIAQQTELL